MGAITEEKNTVTRTRGAAQARAPRLGPIAEVEARAEGAARAAQAQARARAPRLGFIAEVEARTRGAAQARAAQARAAQARARARAEQARAEQAARVQARFKLEQKQAKHRIKCRDRAKTIKCLKKQIAKKEPAEQVKVAKSEYETLVRSAVTEAVNSLREEFVVNFEANHSHHLGGSRWAGTQLWACKFKNDIGGADIVQMVKSLPFGDPEISALKKLEEETHSAILSFFLYEDDLFQHIITPIADGDLYYLAKDIVYDFSMDVPKWIGTEFTPSMLKVKQGLDWLREKELVHRDVKPANILYFKHADSQAIHLKLTDFGFLETVEIVKKEYKNRSATKGTPGYFPPRSLPINQVDYYCFCLAGLDFVEMSVRGYGWKESCSEERGEQFSPEEVIKATRGLKSDYPDLSRMLLEGLLDQQAEAVKARAGGAARGELEPEAPAPDKIKDTQTLQQGAQVRAEALVTAAPAPDEIKDTQTLQQGAQVRAEALVTAAPATDEIKDTQTPKRSALVMGLLVIGLMVAMAVTAGVGLLGAACVLAGVAAVTAGPAAQLAAESTVTLKSGSP